MAYLVREFKTPAELAVALKAGAKLHVWEQGVGDLQGDASGIVVHGPRPGQHKWKVVVELRGGLIVKADKAED